MLLPLDLRIVEGRKCFKKIIKLKNKRYHIKKQTKRFEQFFLPLVDFTQTPTTSLKARYVHM